MEEGERGRRRRGGGERERERDGERRGGERRLGGGERELWMSREGERRRGGGERNLRITGERDSRGPCELTERERRRGGGEREGRRRGPWLEVLISSRGKFIEHSYLRRRHHRHLSDPILSHGCDLRGHRHTHLVPVLFPCPGPCHHLVHHGHHLESRPA